MFYENNQIVLILQSYMRKGIILIFSFVCFFAAAQKPSGRVMSENLLVDAVTLMDNGDYAKAFSLLQAIAKKDSLNDALWYYSGLCKYSEGSAKEAVPFLEKAAALDTANLYYRKTLATALLEQGQGRRAAEILSRLKEQNPALYRNAQQFSLMGDAYMLAGEDSLAKASYQEALLFDPEFTPAIIGLTEYYRAKGNMPAFFVNLERIVRNPMVETGAKTRYLNNLFKFIDPGFFRLWNAQLDSLVCGTVESAPADSAALRLAGEWFYGTGRKREGKEYFDLWLKTYPQDYSARSIKMEMAYVENDYDEFFAQCDTLLSWNLEPSRKVHVLSLMGDALYQKGDRKKAFDAYENALELDPGYVPVLNNYAYFLCLDRKKLSKAQKMSRITVEKEPDNATYLDTYGYILYLRGKAAEAKPYFKRAMMFGGKQSKEVLEHYSKVLEALGEKELSAYYQMLSKETKE